METTRYLKIRARRAEAYVTLRFTTVHISNPFLHHESNSNTSISQNCFQQCYP